MAEPPSTTAAVRSLNDLPDSILLHILSSFPTTADAVETSFLSRKWRNLWLSVPALTFSSHSFFAPNSYPCPKTLRFFTDFIEQTLILRPPNAPLLSFKVQFDFPNNLNFTSHVNSWIRFAISNNAQTLDFDLFDYTGNALKENGEIHDFVCFEFPFYMLRDSNLVRILKLRGCKLSLPPSLENSRFYSLRSLSLEQVVMTDQMLEDLIVACVNVEALELSTVTGCKHFKIRSSKLRELTLKLLYCEEGGSIEIITPNLYALSMLLVKLEDFALTDVSSLVKAHVRVVFLDCWVKVMSFLGHVQHLTTSNMWAELLELKDINSERFQSLEYVELHTSYRKADLIGIAQLLVLSPNLQSLILNNYPVLLPELLPKTYEEISEDFIRQLSFNIPCLRHFKMKSFMGMDCEKNLLIVLLKTAVILERIVIIPAEVGEETPQAPIILDLQFNGLQDFEYLVRQYPRQKTLVERLRDSQGDRV